MVCLRIFFSKVWINIQIFLLFIRLRYTVFRLVLILLSFFVFSYGVFSKSGRLGCYDTALRLLSPLAGWLPLVHFLRVYMLYHWWCWLSWWLCYPCLLVFFLNFFLNRNLNPMNLAHLFNLSSLKWNQVFEFYHYRNQSLSLQLCHIWPFKILYSKASKFF